jgi:hypothetical protein
MSRVRYLAVGLLCLTGVIHLGRLGIPESGAASDVVVSLFGVAYLVIAGFLFRDARPAYYFGAIVPLLGICVGVVGGMLGMLGTPTIWMGCLLTFDLVIAVSCLLLIRWKRSA